jgi:hypothetical protein
MCTMLREGFTKPGSPMLSRFAGVSEAHAERETAGEIPSEARDPKTGRYSAANMDH